MKKIAGIIGALVLVIIIIAALVKTKTPTPNSTATINPSPTTQTTTAFPLTIDTPQNATTVNNAILTISGTTAANASVAVNDKELIADQNGKFSTIMTLDEGENVIDILTNDNLGHSAEKEITVTYTPSQ